MLTFLPKADALREAGFSLLEMLVVLAIMGIVLSLVSVRLSFAIESTRFVKTAESAIEDIRLIRLRALLDERATLVLVSDFSSQQQNATSFQYETLRLPESWTVKGDNISVSATGFCSGGQINISDNKGRNISFALSTGTCNMRRV